MKIPAKCPKCQHEFEVDHEPQQKRAVEARWEKVRAGKGKKKKAAKKKTASKSAAKPVAPQVPKVETFACGMCGKEHTSKAEMIEHMKGCKGE